MDGNVFVDLVLDKLTKYKSNNHPKIFRLSNYDTLPNFPKMWEGYIGQEIIFHL